MYVFHPKWIEIFLVAWKFSEDKKLKQRKFNYKGKIWTHLYFNDPEIIYYRQRGSWYETDTDYIDKIISLEVKALARSLNRDVWHSYLMNNVKRFVSKDHMAFFIKQG